MVSDNSGGYNNRVVIDPNAVDDHFSDYSKSEKYFGQQSNTT